MMKYGPGLCLAHIEKNTGTATDGMWSHYFNVNAICFRAQDGIEVSLKDSVYLQLIPI